MVIHQDLPHMKRDALSIPFNYYRFKSWRHAPAHKSFSCQGSQDTCYKHESVKSRKIYKYMQKQNILFDLIVICAITEQQCRKKGMKKVNTVTDSSLEACMQRETAMIKL